MVATAPKFMTLQHRNNYRPVHISCIVAGPIEKVNARRSFLHAAPLSVASHVQSIAVIFRDDQFRVGDAWVRGGDGASYTALNEK